MRSEHCIHEFQWKNSVLDREGNTLKSQGVLKNLLLSKPTCLRLGLELSFAGNQSTSPGQTEFQIAGVTKNVIPKIGVQSHKRLGTSDLDNMANQLACYNLSDHLTACVFGLWVFVV